MKNNIFERQIIEISNPQEQIGMSRTHTLRPLIESSAPRSSDPFLLLMEDRFGSDDFGAHPHRGMETITYILDGEVQHTDNQGNSGTLKPGDMQYMTAGRGIVHDANLAPGTTAHLLQLWVNLPAADKMVEPRVQTVRGNSIPKVEEEGLEIRVFSGSSRGVTSPTKNYVSVKMLEIRMAKNKQLTEQLPASYNGFVYVIEGSGKFGNAGELSKGQLAWLTRSEEHELSELKVESGDSALKFLVIAGLPLREPVVQRGPFVMNTQEQIVQAYVDFQEGKFV